MFDPMICYCPGLFRNIALSDQEKYIVALDAEYLSPRKDWSVRISAPELLGGFDLAVLQSIACLSRTSKEKPIDPSARPRQKGSIDFALFEALMAATGSDEIQDFSSGPILIGNHSIQTVLRAAGLPENGRNSHLVQKSLQRLSSVSLKFDLHEKESKIKRQHYRLISVFVPPNQADRGYRVHIAINPRLSEFLTNGELPHTRISLVEARKLGTNYAARILHQRLCAVINDGQERPLKMATLMQYLYPSDKQLELADQLRATHVASFRKLAKFPDLLQKARMDETVSALESLQEHIGWAIKLQKQTRDAIDWMWLVKRKRVSRTKLGMSNAARPRA